MQRLRKLITPHTITVAILVLAWLLALVALPASLPLQAASWLAFLALLIAPGYLLGDMITWRLNMDGIERLALALPLGVAVLAIPGTVALLLHLDVHQLALGWAVVSGAVIVAWFVHEWRVVRGRRPVAEPWQIDELLLLGLILGAFLLLLPTLNMYKIDGDAYAVNSFSADALAGLPLNKAEPIFGTDLGPGVRMVFNQSLSLFYLWSYFSVIEPNTLLAAGSKAMLALWAIFAMYTLGKAAGSGSRRFGLLTAGIQLLIYSAAPFIRGDNVSLFYFERINADKFMVPVTILPVIFALAISFVRGGNRRVWAAAAVATFAVSTIHPLIAAMLALALGAFAFVHLLMNVRVRTSWQRVAGLGGLIAIVMFLPLVQLLLSRGESPLAGSYPTSFAGWDVGEKQVPALPFVHVPSLDYYGPLPEMSELEAASAYETTNPFLIWRFALNMDRRRLILFDLDNYISDPSLIIEPAYLLALLLLPMFLWRIRRDIASQFVVGVSLGVVLVMFNPLLTPLIGSFVMPWILWRFVWILPYALVFAMGGQMILGALIKLVARLQRAAGVGDVQATSRLLTQYGTLAFLLLATLVLSPGIVRNISNLNGRLSFAYAYPTPERIFQRLNADLSRKGPAMVLASQDLSVTLPAYVAHAEVLAHRTPTTSEVFPADMQDIALQRLIDQDNFFNTPYLTDKSIATLLKYDAGYVVAESGSELDAQLRLSPQWFTWLLDDEAYTLYEVTGRPEVTTAVTGNSAMSAKAWEEAQIAFNDALAESNDDALARVGLATIAQREGRFEEAEQLLRQTLAQQDLPGLHYQLGRLYAQQGLLEKSIAEFDIARLAAPNVARFHVALGDTCLSQGSLTCVELQYRTAAGLQEWPDEASRLVAEADLWRRRGFSERSLPLYQEAVQAQPNEYNLFVLLSVYRELGMYEDALELVQSMRVLYPLSPEVIAVQADLQAAKGAYDEAISLLRYAIVLQELQVQEATDTHLALAAVLLEAGRLDEAQEEIAYALSQNRYSAVGHSLRGDLFHERDNQEEAIRAYQRAFELDPTQVGVYVALSNELRQEGGSPNDVMVLLQIALREDENDSTLLLALGDQWQRLGESDAAIDAYQAALKRLTPYDSDGRFRPQGTDNTRAFAFSRIAATYEDQGDTQAAINYYHSAIAAAPDEAWPYLLLGDVLRRQDNFDGALHAYEQSLSQDAEEVEAFIRLANLYSAAGESTRAADLYNRALLLTVPETAQAAPRTTLTAIPTVDALYVSDETTAVTGAAAYKRPAIPAVATGELLYASEFSDVSALARLYQGNDHGDQAIDLYLERLRLAEADNESATIRARYYKELGDLYLARYDLDLSATAYAEAVALDGWTPAARLGLAEALTLQGREDEALEELRTAVALAPGSVEAQIALANALDVQGKRTEAMTIYFNTANKHAGNERATLALARAWQDRSRGDRAERTFRETIEHNPGSADAYVGLAELRMDMGAYDEAEDLLNTARRLDFNNVSSYIRLGELEQRRGDTQAALAWFQQAAALPAADQSLNLTLIDSLVTYGDYETALDYTNEALDQRGDDVELLLRRGRIERLFGDYEQALATYTAAQAADPANGRVYGELLELYLAQGLLDKALAANEQAIALAPADTPGYISGSQILSAQDRPEEAIALLEQGTSEAADPALLYSTIATLQLQQGRPEQALETLQDGLDVLGESTGMLLAMGHYYANRGNFEQVLERYNQALESQPDVADVHIALGDLYLLTEEPDKAIAQYREAVTIDPATPGHYLALGNAFEVAGDISQAETAYRQALVAAPTLADAYLRLARLYKGEEKWAEAEDTLTEGLAMAPASGALLGEGAALALAQGDETTALAAADRAVEISPTAATLIRRATIRLATGDSAGTEADLQAALALEPAAIDALVVLGDLYKEAGDLETAETYYTRAAEVMPGVPTGYLRMSTLAREQENRDAVVYWNDLARQAQPGGLLRPSE